MVDSVLVSSDFSLGGGSHVAHGSILVARVSRSDGRHIALSGVGIRRVGLVLAVAMISLARLMVHHFRLFPV